MGTPDSRRVDIVEANLSVSAKRRYSFISGKLNNNRSKNARPESVLLNRTIAIIIPTQTINSNRKLPRRNELRVINTWVGAGSWISKLENISWNLGMTAMTKINIAESATATRIKG